MASIARRGSEFPEKGVDSSHFSDGAQMKLREPFYRRAERVNYVITAVGEQGRMAVPCDGGHSANDTTGLDHAIAEERTRDVPLRLTYTHGRPGREWQLCV